MFSARFYRYFQRLNFTLIELCVTLFDWAGYRQTKGAVKLHLLLDHEGDLPIFACITEGKAMLRYNLFSYRDLWEWLDNPFETPPIAPGGEQLVLGLR